MKVTMEQHKRTHKFIDEERKAEHIHISADDQTDRLYLYAYCLNCSSVWMAKLWSKNGLGGDRSKSYWCVFSHCIVLYCVIFQSRPLESQQTSENQFTPNQSSHLCMLKLQLATAKKPILMNHQPLKKLCSKNRLTCKKWFGYHMFHDNCISLSLSFPLSVNFKWNRLKTRINRVWRVRLGACVCIVNLAIKIT